MNLSEVKEILNAEVILGNDKLDMELTGGAASDLMSDLLRNPKEGALVLTGLTTIQVVRTAVIAGMSAVVFVRGKMPGPDIIDYAGTHDLPLLSSAFNMYSSCGKLYSKGLRSIR